MIALLASAAFSAGMAILFGYWIFYTNDPASLAAAALKLLGFSIALIGTFGPLIEIVIREFGDYET